MAPFAFSRRFGHMLMKSEFRSLHTRTIGRIHSQRFRCLGSDAFHGRSKLLLIGVMQQQKLQRGPLCPRQHCPTAWKNVSQYIHTCDLL